MSDSQSGLRTHAQSTEQSVLADQSSVMQQARSNAEHRFQNNRAQITADAERVVNN